MNIMDIKITDIATADPGLKLPQKTSLKLLQGERRLSRVEALLYRKFMLDKGIGTRAFAIEDIKDLFTEDQDRKVRRFQREAAWLSVSSADECIKNSAAKKNDISCIVSSTCTGYICPGLTSYIVEKAGLNRDIFTSDLAGMGCGGAMPAVRAAYNFLCANRETYAICVSTEICSATIFWGDAPELILSNSIFADGSASCLLTNKKSEAGFTVKGFASTIMPEHRDKLRFYTERSMLRNMLSPEVPEIAGPLVKGLVDEVLKKNGLKRTDVMYWAVHPGGRKVLDKVQAALGLSQADLAHSRDILFRYGNMSSPSVLYVLKSILNDKNLKKGDIVVASSFGAGFSGYAMLLVYG